MSYFTRCSSLTQCSLTTGTLSLGQGTAVLDFPAININGGSLVGAGTIIGPLTMANTSTLFPTSPGLRVNGPLVLQGVLTISLDTIPTAPLLAVNGPLILADTASIMTNSPLAGVPVGTVIPVA